LSIASKVTTAVARKFGDISTIVFIERLSHGRGFWEIGVVLIGVTRPVQTV
jgi:hypothetical protein